MVLATATAGLCILVYKSGLKWGFLEGVRAVPPLVGRKQCNSDLLLSAVTDWTEGVRVLEQSVIAASAHLYVMT